MPVGRAPGRIRGALNEQLTSCGAVVIPELWRSRRDEVPVRRGAQRLSQVSAAPASHGLAACLQLL